MKKVYGYIRVSTCEQNEARQLTALAGFPVPKNNIFIDKQSGKDFNRPQYKRLVKKLKPGSVLVIHSIDRLGRNYDEILRQWRIITKEKESDIVVLDFPLLDTRDLSGRNDLTGRFVADLVLQILAYTAEKERENIRNRQAEGIAEAKARGAKWGRPSIPRPEEADRYAALWKAGKMSLEEIGETFGVSRSKAYDFVRGPA